MDPCTCSTWPDQYWRKDLPYRVFYIFIIICQDISQTYTKIALNHFLMFSLTPNKLSGSQEQQVENCCLNFSVKQSLNSKLTIIFLLEQQLSATSNKVRYLQTLTTHFYSQQLFHFFTWKLIVLRVLFF